MEFLESQYSRSIIYKSGLLKMNRLPCRNFRFEGIFCYSTNPWNSDSEFSFRGPAVFFLFYCPWSTIDGRSANANYADRNRSKRSLSLESRLNGRESIRCRCRRQRGRNYFGNFYLVGLMDGLKYLRWDTGRLG